MHTLNVLYYSTLLSIIEKMPLSEAELNELSASIASQDERAIAAAVFSIDSVLREVITLIASDPEKLQVLVSQCFTNLNNPDSTKHHLC